MRNDYEEKKERRILSLLDAAERMQAAGQASVTAGDAALSMIPFGQPILIGHHSEKRDRNYRARAVWKIDRGIELQEKAAELRRRAEAAEENDSISSDDPEAIRKIEERISGLEAKQQLWREINKCIRRKDDAGLIALGVPEANVKALHEPDFCGRIGIPDYKFSNNSSNIRRLKQRLAVLKHRDAQRQAGQERNEEKAGVRMRSSAETNRTQIFFPGKPPEEIIRELKSNGFRWSPSEGAWQRFQSSWAEYMAVQIMNHYAEKMGANHVQG